MLTKLIPWLETGDDGDRHLREEAAAIREEQQALAPIIDAQTAYLVRKGEINGFTRQLRAGFQSNLPGE
jgi:hypothetical protein